MPLWVADSSNRLVKMTVTHLAAPDQHGRLYSIERIEVEGSGPASMMEDAPRAPEGGQEEVIRPAGPVQRFADAIRAFNARGKTKFEQAGPGSFDLTEFNQTDFPGGRRQWLDHRITLARAAARAEGRDEFEAIREDFAALRLEQDRDVLGAAPAPFLEEWSGLRKIMRAFNIRRGTELEQRAKRTFGHVWARLTRYCLACEHERSRDCWRAPGVSGGRES